MRLLCGLLLPVDSTFVRRTLIVWSAGFWTRPGSIYVVNWSPLAVPFVNLKKKIFTKYSVGICCGTFYTVDSVAVCFEVVSLYCRRVYIANCSSLYVPLAYVAERYSPYAYIADWFPFMFRWYILPTGFHLCSVDIYCRLVSIYVPLIYIADWFPYMFRWYILPTGFHLCSVDIYCRLVSIYVPLIYIAHWFPYLFRWYILPTGFHICSVDIYCRRIPLFVSLLFLDFIAVFIIISVIDDVYFIVYSNHCCCVCCCC